MTDVDSLIYVIALDANCSICVDMSYHMRAAFGGRQFACNAMFFISDLVVRCLKGFDFATYNSPQNWDSYC